MGKWIARNGHQLSGTIADLKRDTDKTHVDDGSIKAPGVADLAFEEGIESIEGEDEDEEE